MEIKTDSKRLREIMFHLFIWFKISIYYFLKMFIVVVAEMAA